MKRISKLISFFFLLVLGAYLLFPVWSGWLIRTLAPANITLQSFESAYPGLKDIYVDHIQFTINGMTISIDGMNVDYDLAEVVVEKVQILKHLKQQSSEQQVFRLPKLALNDYAILEKFTKIKINQFAYKEDVLEHRLSHLVFTKSAVNNYELTVSEVDVFNQSIASLQCKISLYHENNKIKLLINQSSDLIADITYQQNQQKVTLSGKVDANNLASLLAYDFSELPVIPQGIVFIDWAEDSLDNSVEMIVKNKLQLSNKLLKQTIVPDVDPVNALSEKILVPVVIKINSASDKLPVVADVNISAQSPSEVLLQLPQAEIRVVMPVLKLQSQIKLQQLVRNEMEIIVSDIQFALVSSKLNVLAKNIPLELAVEESNLKGTVDNLHGSFATITKNGLNISAEFIADKINGNYNKALQSEDKPIYFEARPEISLDLAISSNPDQGLLSNGKLILSKLNISERMSVTEANMTLIWKDVKPSLSHGNITVQLDSSDVTIPEMNLDGLQIESKIKLSQKQITGQGQLLVNQQLLTPYQFTYNKDSSDVSIQLKKHQLANPLFNQFLQLEGGKNNTLLKIVAGIVTHQGKLILSDKIVVESNLDVNDMTFQFGENNIQGLNIKHKLSSIEPLKLDSAIKIKSINFASGLEIKNLTTEIETDKDTSFEIKNLNGEIFEGKFIADSIQATTDGFDTSIIKLHDLSLTELIFFMDIPGMYGEGKLGFIMPLTMASGSLTVKDGTFNANGNGIIKYSTEQSGSEADNNIALQALENFHYKSLNGSISYNKSGQYRIKLHLLGANPELYDGYPVDFTLNLQGELSGVFRSLFISGNFEQAVMERVKSSQIEQ